MFITPGYAAPRRLDMILVMSNCLDALPTIPRGVRRRLQPGETLFVAGDRAVGMVQVLAGMMELRRPGAGGQDGIMQRAGPGDSLGEASLFEACHHCDAVASLPTELDVLSPAAFHHAATADPRLPLALARLLAQRLVQARARAEWLALPSAEARLLAALNARPAAADGARQVGGSWRSLAAECGLSSEATYRALARLERRGDLRRMRTENGAGAVLRGEATPASAPD